MPDTPLLDCGRPSLGEAGRNDLLSVSNSEPGLDPGMVSRPECVAGGDDERIVSRVDWSTEVVSQLSKALTGDELLTAR